MLKLLDMRSISFSSGPHMSLASCGRDATILGMLVCVYQEVTNLDTQLRCGGNDALPEQISASPAGPPQSPATASLTTQHSDESTSPQRMN